MFKISLTDQFELDSVDVLAIYQYVKDTINEGNLEFYEKFIDNQNLYQDVTLYYNIKVHNALL